MLENSILVDIVLFVTLATLALAIVSGLVSVVFSLLKRPKSDGKENRVPVRLISFAVAGGTIALLALGCLCGSSAPVSVNGELFTDSLWLRVTDMFIVAIAAMGLIAILLIIIAECSSAKRGVLFRR